MIPDVVVDIGNSRIKCGRCSATGIEQVTSLHHDDATAWHDKLAPWLAEPLSWIVSGVNPGQRNLFINWLREKSQAVTLLASPKRLPLQVRLERPEHVGIDRLLDAVAANIRRQAGETAIVVDAGSAVTVDFVDKEGAFRGGAIFPGIRLMTEALHNYTALLPLVRIGHSCPPLPGITTRAAVEAGVFWTVVGGIKNIAEQLSQCGQRCPILFLTGGDASLLAPALDPGTILWPEMTLEGIRVSALAW